MKQSGTLSDFIITIDRAVVPIFHSMGRLNPAIWHAVTESGEHKIQPSPCDDKDMLVSLMKAYFAINKIVRYVFISEAWILQSANLSAAEMREIEEHGLKHHPGRIEVLMYHAEDASGLLSAQRDIHRAGRHRPTLGPIEFITPQQIEGRFLGMLPQRGTVQ